MNTSDFFLIFFCFYSNTESNCGMVRSFGILQWKEKRPYDVSSLCRQAISVRIYYSEEERGQVDNEMFENSYSATSESAEITPHRSYPTEY